MGRATTLRLREYGATVYSADRNHSALKETCEQSGAEPCVIDISKAAECNALVERAKTEQGKLDGIVNFSSIWSEIAAMLASGRGLHNILNEPTDFYY